MSSKQTCYGCGQPVLPFDRYPNYLCLDCTSRLTDEHGVEIEFFNSGLGMLYARYKETPSLNYPNNRCFLENNEYRANEGRFGGVVVQPSTADASISITLAMPKKKSGNSV